MIGIAFAVFFVSLGSQFGYSVLSLFDHLAFLSVISGVFCVILCAGLNLKDVLDVIAEIKMKYDVNDRINDLIYVNEQIKKRGFTVCEQFQKKFKDNFLKKGLRLIADNPGPEFNFEEALRTEIQSLKQRNQRFLDYLSFGANVSPGIGLIGTLVGLSFNTHPSSISHAVLTTLYGALLSNFFFLPLHQFFKKKLEDVELGYEVTFTGLINLRNGLHSIYLEEHLSGYKYATKSN